MTGEAGTDSRPIIRESAILTAFGWFTAFWGWLYTTDLSQRADEVSSRQWRYLMSIPGHELTWTVWFGVGALLLTVGLIANWYVMRALGYIVTAAGCGTITGFYFAAPFVDPGLTTLGYHVWYAWGGVLLIIALLNVRPVRWF